MLTHKPNQDQSTIIKTLAAPVAKVIMALGFGTLSPLTFVGGAAADHFAKKWEDAAKSDVDARIKKMGDEIVRDLEPIFAHETTSANLAVVVKEIAQTIEDTLNTKLIIDTNLDAERLRDELELARPKQVSQLDEIDQSLYLRALKELAQRVIALAPELKDFQQKTYGQILTQLDTIEKSINAFQTDVKLRRRTSELAHLQALSDNLDEMELFGADLPPGKNRHPLLKIAYVSLNLKVGPRSQPGSNEGPKEQYLPAEYLFDQVLEARGRLLITGDAGSGKSTLTRWLALEASRTQLGFDNQTRVKRYKDSKNNSPRYGLDIFEDLLESTPWRERMPFLVRLRDCSEGELPDLASIPQKLVKALGTGESGWVENVFVERRGLLIFDGIDEIPHDRRDRFRQELESYLRRFPETPILLTARPAATDDWGDWLDMWKFQKAEINPMSLDQRMVLIGRWHDAVRAARIQAKDSPEKIQLITEKERKLCDELANDSRLARLASYPLLCSVICALHLWKGAEPLRSYWQMSEDCCNLLLHVRDLDAQIKIEKFPACYRDLLYVDKRAIVQSVAVKMVDSGFRSSMATTEAIKAAGPVLAYIPGRRAVEAKSVIESLLERSGMLRERRKGEVEFIHNLFKEFLVADSLITENKIDELKSRCTDSDWHEVIVFAAAYTSKRDLPSLLIETILAYEDHESRVLALRCKEVARFIREDLEERLDAVARSIFPPENEEQAKAIATLGNTYVNRLTSNDSLTTEQAVCSVLALGYINTRDAREAARTYASDDRVFDLLVNVISPLYIDKAVNSLTQRPNHRYYEPWRALITNLEPFKDDVQFKGDIRFQKLNLSGTKVTDLTLLQYLPQLDGLDLTSTPISDLKHLTVLRQLQTLNLSGTQVSDLGPLQNLTQLQTLYLSGIQVSDLGPLQDLTQLQNLVLDSTQVSDLGPLQDLTQLQNLVLDGTQVSDLGPLQDLTQLRKLDLRSTGVSDLILLHGLNELSQIILDVANRNNILGCEKLGSRITWI